MKKYFFIFMTLALFLPLACNQSAKSKEQNKQVEVVYTCPMHPEVTSDKPGDCPKCGMALVKKDEHTHPDSSSNVDDEIK